MQIIWSRSLQDTSEQIWEIILQYSRNGSVGGPLTETTFSEQYIKDIFFVNENRTTLKQTVNSFSNIYKKTKVA
jgi:hypothetical protein